MFILIMYIECALLVPCCHSQTVNAYVFVIRNYSNSELQLSNLELIFSYAVHVLLLKIIPCSLSEAPHIIYKMAGSGL